MVALFYASLFCALPFGAPLNELNHAANDATFLNRLHNISGLTWMAGPSPRFCNHTLSQIKQLCGTQLHKLSSSHLPVLKAHLSTTALTTPPSFDVASRWPNCSSLVGHIRDQGQCGSCWAFATAETLNDRLCIATGGAFQTLLSAQVAAIFLWLLRKGLARSVTE